VPYRNQWGLRGVVVVKVHEAMELPFGVVSGVGLCIGALDGGSHLPRERGFRFFNFFSSVSLNGFL